MAALRVPEMCFWPAKTRKSLNFLRCIYFIDLVLKYGSDINEGNWLQHLFYFIVLMGIVASVIGMSFLAVFHVLDWSVLVLHFYGNVCNRIPKKIWPRMGWFKGFLLENGFFRWLHICMEWKPARNAQLLFFFDDIKFFRSLVWGIFWSVLWKCLYFLSIGFCNINW